MKEWRAQAKLRDPEKVRRSEASAMLKINYGITMDDYDRMFEDQGGVCALCGGVPKTTRLSVDHDHETGRIRGLLCRWCNSALGRFGDNVLGIRRVVAYLEV